MAWKVRSFINGIPIEEYTKEEREAFFKKAIDNAFKSIGYVPVEEGKQIADGECSIPE